MDRRLVCRCTGLRFPHKAGSSDLCLFDFKGAPRFEVEEGDAPIDLERRIDYAGRVRDVRADLPSFDWRPA